MLPPKDSARCSTCAAATMCERQLRAIHSAMLCFYCVHGSCAAPRVLAAAMVAAMFLHRARAPARASVRRQVHILHASVSCCGYWLSAGAALVLNGLMLLADE